ncbi:hypothetical protein [Spirosoma spitsbergense]|uniref:hypothetical protein n=1 Tax=Spirosoma spitsbergense TaxID=431554 RepID=UPI000370073F|nr:hypothetical protein [Spirosoma spitsbergense]
MNQSTNEPNEPDRWETDFRQWGQRPQPEPRPFFYTRLQARLNESVESATWLPWWLRRPAYAYSALCMLVLLNVSVATTIANTPAADDEPTTVASAFQSDYSVDSTITPYE